MTPNPQPTTTTGYKQAKSTMRILGPILIAIGGILFLIGIITFFGLFLSFGSRSPSAGFLPTLILAFPGLLLLGIGGALTKAGYLKEITQYAAKETSPAISTVTTAVKAAINDNDIPCPDCSLPIEPDSQFCSHCGSQVQGTLCPQCQNQLEPNDRFCNSCGQQIENT